MYLTDMPFATALAQQMNKEINWLTDWICHGSFVSLVQRFYHWDFQLVQENTSTKWVITMVT
jgi:hypothetical protein